MDEIALKLLETLWVFFDPKKLNISYFKFFSLEKFFREKVGLNFGSVLSSKIKCIFSRKKIFLIGKSFFYKKIPKKFAIGLGSKKNP